MNDKRLQGSVENLTGLRIAAKKAGALVVCLGLCCIFNPNLAAAASAEEQNKGVARTAFLEYLNHKDFKNFEAIHTRNFVKHFNNAAPEDLSQEMQDAKGQFVSSSDLTFSVNWMIAEGDKVAVCFTAKGTHDGVFRGFPPTGKKFEVSAMTVWRFVNGKIAEEWVFSNDFDLYSQLGLLKELASAAR
jgi:steroid delta-isomerase-like uncharacterized protein